MKTVPFPRFSEPGEHPCTVDGYRVLTIAISPETYQKLRARALASGGIGLPLECVVTAITGNRLDDWAEAQAELSEKAPAVPDVSKPLK